MDIRVFSRLDDRYLSFIHVMPGDWVVIKPNLVKESNENDLFDWQSVITSPLIIQSVCEYVCRNLAGQGKVTICDAPQTDSSFAKIAVKLNLFSLAEECQNKYGIQVEVIDLRNEEWTNENGIITERKKLVGDPNGAIAFNLGKDSLFYGYQGEGRYYGADYDVDAVNSHHNWETQEYLICGTPILADVFINLPKLKTHKKAGVTLNLKNLVGINADKNWLPHHTNGSPLNGGDQFPEHSLKNRLEHRAVKLARELALRVPGLGPKIAQKMRKVGIAAFGDGKQVIRSGNWCGNDTTWRMVLDLNRCFLYGNPDGTLRTDNPKRYYSVIDGIIGMEGAGPLAGDPVLSNVVICGTDPVCTDMVAARVMGFDWRKIPIIREAYSLENLPITNASPEDVFVESDNPDWCGRFLDIENRQFLSFKPHFGWVNHIEHRNS